MDVDVSDLTGIHAWLSDLRVGSRNDKGRYSEDKQDAVQHISFSRGGKLLNYQTAGSPMEGPMAAPQAEPGARSAGGQLF
jgi:hypothetical protein